MLKQRVLSGIIFITIIISSVTYSSLELFTVLVALLLLGLSIEWTKLFFSNYISSSSISVENIENIENIEFTKFRKFIRFRIFKILGIQNIKFIGLLSVFYLLISSLIFNAYLVNYNTSFFYSYFSVINIALWFLLFALVIIFNKYYVFIKMFIEVLKMGNVANINYISYYTKIIIYYLFGFIIFANFGLALIYIKKLNFCYLIILLAMIWVFDSCSYLFGKLSGKLFDRHLLISQVSPNKTIEGFIGGSISLLLVNLIIYNYIDIVHNNFPILSWLFMSLIIIIFAQFGDLFESMLKRIFNIKDTGNIIPGHGGLYDRFDSLISSAPIYYFMLYY